MLSFSNYSLENEIFTVLDFHKICGENLCGRSMCTHTYATDLTDIKMSKYSEIKPNLQSFPAGSYFCSDGECSWAIWRCCKQLVFDTNFEVFSACTDLAPAVGLSSWRLRGHFTHRKAPIFQLTTGQSCWSYWDASATEVFSWFDEASWRNKTLKSGLGLGHRHHGSPRGITLFSVSKHLFVVYGRSFWTNLAHRLVVL